jgi:zinc transport system permease protein
VTLWYNFLSLLPFEWLQYEFMKNALLAVIIVTPLLGLLGTMVVNNKMAFFSDSLGHSALTGIGIGVLAGFQNPLGSMIIFAVAMAIGITYLKNVTKFSPDTIIGVFASTAVALGIVILSRNGGFNHYSKFLIGDILSIAPKEITAVGFVFLAVMVFWIFFFNELLIVSINPALARSRGISAFKLETVFTILVAVVVTVAIQWVGLLVINSLLILPAAAARNLAANMKSYHLIAVGISIFSGLFGLVLSYYWGTATGATIVLCSAVVFFLTLLGRRVKG